MKFKKNKKDYKLYLLSLNSFQKRIILLDLAKKQEVSFEKDIEICTDDEIIELFKKVVDFYV